MPKPRKVVSLGIPALFVALLALIALWRIGLPPDVVDDQTATAQPGAGGPVTLIAELVTQNAIGRQAHVNDVLIRRMVTTRAFWIGERSETAFVVLDADVRRLDSVRVAAGEHVRLAGIVRPAPTADRAMRQWGLDDDTAREVEQQGTYLHATEIGAPVS